jgi:HSP20 family molecular chaperone IbpA
MYNTQNIPNQLMPGMKSRGPSQSGRPSSLQNFLLGILINSIGQAYTSQDTPMRPAEAENPQEVFETHEYVFVRVPIPKRVDKSRIVMYVRTSRVTIRWAPGSINHVYQLPSDVLTKGAEASIRDNVLEIRMPKEPNPDVRRIYVNQDKKA